jgi:asparagine synthase (glutamine-hydrolysing)
MSAPTTADCGRWWAALPDAPAPVSWPGSGSGVLARHLSGRPWVVGRVDSARLRIITLRTARIVVIGTCLIDNGILAADAEQAAARGEFDALTRWPGSFQLAVSLPGTLMVYGDVAGLRRVYWSRHGEHVVVGDSPRRLAALAGAPLEPVWLAARLCVPEMPTVVRDSYSPYQGVTPVPPGHRALVVGQGLPQIGRYWSPPRPELGLQDGAARLRSALDAAVSGRLRRTDVGAVTLQLSGGMDSAALALLAGGDLVSVTMPSRSLVNNDTSWARTITAHLASRHVVLAEAPDFFSDLPGAVPSGMDEPIPTAAGAARTGHLARTVARHGNVLHLNGQGGDEVLLAHLAYLGDALRSPRRGLRRHLRGHAALRNVSTWQLARRAWTSGSYAVWMREAADTLGSAADPACDLVAWEAHPQLPPWASEHAHALMCSALLSTEAVPSADRGVHATLARIRAAGASAAGYARTLEALAGLTVEFPFLDRAVIEACLSVRPWERTDPWQFKPLLRHALKDLAPRHLLTRTTKSHYDDDLHHGWIRHRVEIGELLERPVLAGYGLTDSKSLSRVLSGGQHAGLPPAFLTELLAVELWLRDVIDNGRGAPT